MVDGGKGGLGGGRQPSHGIAVQQFLQGRGVIVELPQRRLGIICCATTTALVPRRATSVKSGRLNFGGASGRERFLAGAIATPVNE